MDERKIEQILRHYSPEAQTIKAIEELSELQKELAKILNKQGDIKAMKSELADVFVMMTQLMVIYDVDPEEFDAEVAYKLDRQVKRISAENGTDCPWT